MAKTAALPKPCAFGTGNPLLAPLGRSSGAVVLARRGEETLAFVADEDARRVSVVDVGHGREVATAELAAVPGSLLVAADGKVAVTLPHESEVAVLAFDGEAFGHSCSVPTAPEPVALALTPDDRTLLVVSAWGHAFGAYATADFARRYELELERDPRAVIVTDDGRRAFVAHGVGGRLSVVDLGRARAESVSLDAPPTRDAMQRKLVFEVSAEAALASAGENAEALAREFDKQHRSMLVPERVGNQGYALALAKSGRVLIPQVEVNAGTKELRTAGYGDGGAQPSVAAVVAAVDASTLRLDVHSIPEIASWRAPVNLNENERCLLPRAAAMDEAEGVLLVTCLGTDLLVGYDAVAPSPVDAEMLRVRVAAGPTGVAVDAPNRRAVVWSQFERALSLVPLPATRAPLSVADPGVTRIPLGVARETLSAELALGRRLFHAVNDPRIARDGRACASCHVGGRDDGLVWSTPGGPRRTKTLAGLLRGTAPYSWDGSAATLHDQIRSTLERLDGQGGLRPVELDALIAYVAALPPPPRGEADGKVERGAELFHSAATGCATCHRGEAKSDLARHSVASDTLSDVTARFDTPSLAFLSGRAPYFHDGRYASLRELLAAKDDKMGHTSQLSADDLGALEAFLGTL
ncbi:MAG TPA: cytochrome C peroxidase [Polyangiaceae bacterium]